MHSLKDFLQAGITAPVIILLVVAVIGISLGGFVILKKNSQSTVPTELSQSIESPQPETTEPQQVQVSPRAEVKQSVPFIGIWKVDKHYVYGRDSKQWFENQAVIDESQRYLRFTQEGKLCKGAPNTQEFICTDKEEAYQVSGDLILLPNVPSSRIRWSMTEGKLELIYEFPVQEQLEPVIKYILLPQ